MQMTDRAKLGLWVLASCAALLCARPARAHHAFAGTYDLNQTVTIEGKVVEFLFRNPHSVVLVETPAKDGKPTTWAAEWGGGAELSRRGIEKDTLKPGDRVVVTGNPSRNAADRRLHLQTITRPADGWSWTSSPQ
jgi:hypothetical protein